MRAPASDYDDWANLHCNPGWSFAELLPLIKKVCALAIRWGSGLVDIVVAQCETYENGLRRPTHGYDGPLKVSTGGIFSNVGKDFLDMVSKYDKTRPFVDDPNRMIDDVNRYAVSAPSRSYAFSCLMLW